MQASVDVRLQDAGEAYMTIRATQSQSGGQVLFGYRYSLIRDVNGDYTLTVTFQDEREQADIYSGPLPALGGEEIPEWINLKVITLGEEMAFFANDEFVHYLNKASKLTGSIALGVGDNTTADFDTFEVRDTSPHGQ